MHDVTVRIVNALGPFTPNESFTFDPRKGFRTYHIAQGKHGRFEIVPKGKAGFFEELFANLPRKLQRRFVLLDEGKAPSQDELEKIERQILGHARRTLMRNLSVRIKALPHLSGQNGGASKLEENERRKIRERVKYLMKSGNDGTGMSKNKAVEIVAKVRILSTRQVWRILKECRPNLAI